MALYYSAPSGSRADTDLTEWYSQPSDGGLRIARDKYVYFLSYRPGCIFTNDGKCQVHSSLYRSVGGHLANLEPESDGLETFRAAVRSARRVADLESLSTNLRFSAGLGSAWNLTVTTRKSR